jgi:phosphoglycolate phosphatase
MKAAAVIFDKDGTLIDFDAFWVSVSVKAIEDVLTRTGMDPSLLAPILEAFGVRDGVTDMNGILCKGTYEEMGHIVYHILQKKGCTLTCDEIVKLVLDAYNRNADAGTVKPTCPDLSDVLKDLKARGVKLAVVTTDNREITCKCLDSLGVTELFDHIYTDDGVTPTKPDPFCVYDLCRRTGVEKDAVVMVGDTMTDMRFAQNAGIPAIGIACRSENRAVLEPHAYAVISAMTELKAKLKPLIGLE